MSTQTNDENLWDKHYAIRKFIHQYANKGTVLELGCGEGLLQAKLDTSAYSKFIGIDIADMATFEPEEEFDVIVFNESLHSSDSPLLLLDKYFNYLKDNGKMILSVFGNVSNTKLLKIINSMYRLIDEHISQNHKGLWHCNVYVFS